MDSDNIVNRLLDTDTMMRDMLHDVSVSGDVYRPPLYNILSSLHSIVQNNIEVIINETGSGNNCLVSCNEFHNKIHFIKVKETQECSICLDNVETNMTGCVLPCLHLFHESCIKRWLTMNNAICPNCRTHV